MTFYSKRCPADHILITSNLNTQGAITRRPKKESAYFITNEWLECYLELVGGFLERKHIRWLPRHILCALFPTLASGRLARWTCEMLILYSAQRG